MRKVVFALGLLGGPRLILKQWAEHGLGMRVGGEKVE
jgi:hypothetical protein